MAKKNLVSQDPSDPVFSVTWSFRNHTNMLILVHEKSFFIMLKSVLWGFVGTVVQFLGLFDE